MTMTIIELAKKYGTFAVTDKSLIVPATIETAEIAWLISEGYSLVFEFSPLVYAAAEEMIKQSIEKEG